VPAREGWPAWHPLKRRGPAGMRFLRQPAGPLNKNEGLLPRASGHAEGVSASAGLLEEAA